MDIWMLINWGFMGWCATAGCFEIAIAINRNYSMRARHSAQWRFMVYLNIVVVLLFYGDLI